MDWTVRAVRSRHIRLLTHPCVTFSSIRITFCSIFNSSLSIMPSFQLTVPLLMLTASGLLAPLYSRLSTLGAFRYPLLTKNIHGSEHHFISNSINCEDLHLDTRSGLLFTSCQAVDGSRNGWFPPLTRWENVEDAWKGDGGIYVVDPNVSPGDLLVRCVCTHDFHCRPSHRLDCKWRTSPTSHL